MRLIKRDHRGDRRSLRSSRATVGSSGPRAACAAASRESAVIRWWQKEGRDIIMVPWTRVDRPHRTGKALREERAGRPSAERREAGGRGSAHALRRTRGARSRLRGDEAPHGDSRMRAAGADARRTAARPRTARKAEGPTRRTRPGIANAARFGAAAGRTACRTRRVGQDCGLRLTSRSPHDRQDAQVARPEAGAPLPRSAPHVGKRKDE